jgi:hypothetical protein
MTIHWDKVAKLNSYESEEAMWKIVRGSYKWHNRKIAKKLSTKQEPLTYNSVRKRLLELGYKSFPRGGRHETVVVYKNSAYQKMVVFGLDRIKNLRPCQISRIFGVLPHSVTELGRTKGLEYIKNKKKGEKKNDVVTKVHRNSCSLSELRGSLNF